MPVRGRTGHTNGGTKRSVDIEALKRQAEEMALTPPTPERRASLKRLRNKIYNADQYRSDRQGA